MVENMAKYGAQCVGHILWIKMWLICVIRVSNLTSLSRVTSVWVISVKYRMAQGLCPLAKIDMLKRVAMLALKNEEMKN